MNAVGKIRAAFEGGVALEGALLEGLLAAVALSVDPLHVAEVPQRVQRDVHRREDPRALHHPHWCAGLGRLRRLERLAELGQLLKQVVLADVVALQQVLQPQQVVQRPWLLLRHLLLIHCILPQLCRQLALFGVVGASAAHVE
mmetsp:Transcript_9764/g.9546  ORF Transcript_9764/g.9546 Transcript_9764/m.9546 type:complete len:143 (-) Transcript_9764:337-765(-)